MIFRTGRLFNRPGNLLISKQDRYVKWLGIQIQSQQPRATQQQQHQNRSEIGPKNDPGSTVQWGWDIMDRYSHVPVQKQALYLLYGTANP